MTLELTPELVAWSIPEEGWLRIQIKTTPLQVRETFYLVKTPAVERSQTRHAEEESWAWFMWSIAGKPTVSVRSGGEILDKLVTSHPVLGRICDQFGLTPIT